MKIEILQENHNKKSFDCGQDDLNKFLKQYASQHHKALRHDSTPRFDTINRVANQG